MQILHPPGWAKPRGYSNGIVASGQLVFVAGQIGWNANQEFETQDLVGQTRQALENIVAILAESNARPNHITRMTWYIVDKREYLANTKAIGKAYRDIIGNHYPAMTAFEVSGLLANEAQVEIEATAVIP